MNGMDLIVERRIRNWQHRSQLGHQDARSPQPVLTISRQHGAGGELLGKSLAAKLGFEFWDRELLHEMAEHAHVSEKLFESLDEQPRNAIAGIVRSISHSADPGPSDYMYELQRQIRTIAYHGRAVIMGRGGQLIVDPANALRIRVIAPLAERVQSVATSRGVSASEATGDIQRIDGAHADFLRQNWNKDINDPELYDITINLSFLRPDAAAEAIYAAYQERFGSEVRAQ